MRCKKVKQVPAMVQGPRLNRSRLQPCRRSLVCRAVTRVEVQRSLNILQVDGVAGLADLKEAYYGRMRALHPDVNLERDTTTEAAAVNAAYSTLLSLIHI